MHPASTHPGSVSLEMVDLGSPAAAGPHRSGGRKGQRRPGGASAAAAQPAAVHACPARRPLLIASRRFIECSNLSTSAKQNECGCAGTRSGPRCRKRGPAGERALGGVCVAFWGPLGARRGSQGSARCLPPRKPSLPGGALTANMIPIAFSSAGNAPRRCAGPGGLPPLAAATVAGLPSPTSLPTPPACRRCCCSPTAQPPRWAKLPSAQGRAGAPSRCSLGWLNGERISRPLTPPALPAPCRCSTCVGLVYPAYCTLKAVEQRQPSPATTNKWLM